MATPILKINNREVTGTNKVSKLRKEGKVPGVVYSKNEETREIYVSERELESFLSRYGSAGRLELDLDGEKKYAIIKDVQRGVLKNRLLHIDLQTLDEKEKIRLTMPITVINREKAEVGDKIFQLQTSEVEIQTYPRYIPDVVEVDAALLEEKDSLTMEDLDISSNENIEILNDMDTVIATIVYATVEEPESEDTEETEAVEEVEKDTEE
ncbi:MAG: 50S ribosomal protein L25 [Clostridiales bacterium]|nr:50S ribosomal protein L25 [Clostridiales bacterium]